MSSQPIRDVYLDHIKYLGQLLESAETAVRESYNLKRTADLAHNVAREREERLRTERDRVLADFKREFPDLPLSGV